MFVEVGSSILADYDRPTLGISLVLAAWLVWRLWRFNIYPLLHPDQPPEYPYYIPCHIYGFFNDSNKLITDARKSFGSTEEIFSLTVAGQRTYVLTSSTDVSEAYRNTTSLSFNQFVQQLMRWSGNSEFCVKRMYEIFGQGEKSGGFPNPHQKPLGTLSRDLHIHQLFPGENLTELMSRFITHFQSDLELSNLRNFSSDVQDSGNVVVMPLMSWVLWTFTSAGQQAYFDKQLDVIHPNMVEDFLEFDELGWQVLYQYPQFLSRKMHAARDKLVKAFEVYFSMPPEKRGNAAWFVTAEEREMRSLGIDTHDIAVMMVVVYWAINTNTPKACFWLVFYLLQSPSVLEAIREETKPAFANDKFNVDHVNKNCPLLSAAFDEMLRFCSFSGSVRFVTNDMSIGNKTLKEGGRLLIAYRQLHFDAEVFGSNINGFDAYRFFNEKERTKSSKFRPFGGGSTQCPGRYVARQSVLSFVAMLIHKYDIQPVRGQAPVEPDLKRPVLGMATKQDEPKDYMVKMSKRQ